MPWKMLSKKFTAWRDSSAVESVLFAPDRAEMYQSISAKPTFVEEPWLRPRHLLYVQAVAVATKGIPQGSPIITIAFLTLRVGVRRVALVVAGGRGLGAARARAARRGQGQSAPNIGACTMILKLLCQQRHLLVEHRWVGVGIARLVWRTAVPKRSSSRRNPRR